MTLLVRSLPRTTSLAREFALPVVATAAIAATADVRIPLGLPGHRGLVWLTLLVAVLLATRRTGTVTAAGSAATVLAVATGTATLPGAFQFVAAAVALEAIAAAVRGRPWLIAVLAAPVHLVALVLPAGGSASGAGALAGLLGHLGFGLLAGLLGWALAAASRRYTAAAGEEPEVRPGR